MFLGSPTVNSARKTNMTNDKAPSQSEDNDVINTDDKSADQAVDTTETMIPKSRLDSVIAQREEMKEKYEQTSEELKELKDTVKELQDSVSRKQTETHDEAFTSEEEQALSKIERALKQRKFVTTEQLEELKNITKRNSVIERLQDKYGKGSGYPEFKTDDVMIHAKRNGFGDNLEAAYRDMHFDAFVQMAARKSSVEPPDSEKPVGGEREAKTDITGKVAEMDLSDYEQNRNDILSRFRRSVLGR